MPLIFQHIYLLFYAIMTPKFTLDNFGCQHMPPCFQVNEAMNLKTQTKTKLTSDDTHHIGCSAPKGDVIHRSFFVLRAIRVSAIIWRALRLLVKHLESTFSNTFR